MKSLKFITVCLVILVSGNVFGQGNDKAVTTRYDAQLAQKVGADDYGMKTYYFVFLKRGNASIADSALRMNIQVGHLKNIMRLANENKMVLAGPFLDDQQYRGIFIFNASSQEEVEEWLKTDPAIKAGVLTAEVHPWYGSAALMELAPIHESIQKHSIAE